MTRAIAKSLFRDLRTATRGGRGVTRESYGDGENEAIALVRKAAHRHGLETGIDGAANLVISLPGRADERPYIACGSHLDSVPEGGNYDGAAGVVAGLLAMIRMHAEGAPPVRNVKTIALRGEESAWYGKAYAGSSALFGKLAPEDLAAPRREGDGTLGEAMARVGARMDLIEAGTPMIDPRDIAGYIELHIEQGPVLVAADRPTAVVTGIRGNIRHRRIACTGEAGHSGAVPREQRRDAVFAAARLIATLDDHWRDRVAAGEDLVVTAGVIETDARAHSMSRIPGEVFFSFEARSQSQETLESFYALLRAECDRLAADRGVAFAFDRRIDSTPARMDRAWIDTLVAHSDTLGLPTETVASGAGHDAVLFAAAGIPAAMIFIRNRNGSHNPREAMDIEDFMKGCDLLHRSLMDPPR